MGNDENDVPAVYSDSIHEVFAAKLNALDVRHIVSEDLKVAKILNCKDRTMVQGKQMINLLSR